MGVVYKARDPEIDRIVAIKVVRLGFSLDDEQRKKFLERFRREAKIAGNLVHPHIAGVYDIDFSGPEPYIAMEYFPGAPLSRLVDGTLPDAEEVRLIVRQLASALDYAHGVGVVHRDIKPANVLYKPGPLIKLVDFGIAKVEALELTATGEFIGTPSYMSPEIFAGDPVDGRTDLFSVGVILYQLLTGKRPFEAETVSRTIYRVLHEDPAPPSEQRDGLSPLWDIICARLLEKKPKHRYRSAGALIEDLDSLARGTLVAQEPTEPVPSPASKWRYGWAVLAVVIAIVGAWLWPEPAPISRPASFEPAQSMSALFAEAEQAVGEGRLADGEALRNAIAAHEPDYAGLETLELALARERFRRRLPLRFVARHEHLVGHCTGDLHLREDGIVFETSRHGTWHWHFDEIVRLERIRGDALDIQVSSGNYDITFMRPELSRRDFDSYLEVLETATSGAAEADASE